MTTTQDRVEMVLMIFDRKNRTSENVVNHCDRIRQECNDPLLKITVITSDLAYYSAIMQMAGNVEADVTAPNKIKLEQMDIIERELDGFSQGSLVTSNVYRPFVDSARNYFRDIRGKLAA